MRPMKLTMSAYGPYAGLVEVDFEKLGSEGIYLVTGDTGAGKTTVFDAISFALFGEASGPDRPVSTLRSDFAAPDAETYVDLTFEYRGQRYRVWRCPGYRRAKKRGSGTTEQAPDALLERPGRPPVTKVRDVNAAIEELLGIDRSQFSQIVMIAQGDFRRLLTASTADRATIFRRLFATDACQAFQTRLKEREGEARRAVAQVLGEISTIARSAVLPEQEEGRDDDATLPYGTFGEDALACLRDGTAPRIELEEALRAVVDADERALPDAESSCAEATKELDEAKLASDRAQRAAQAISDLAVARDEATRLAAARLACEEAAKEADATLPERDALAARAGVLKGKLPDYARLEEAAGRLEEARQRADAAHEAAHRAQSALDTLRSGLTAREDELEALRDADRHLAEASAERDRRAADLEDAKAALSGARALKEACVQEEAALRALESAKQASDEANAEREGAERTLLERSETARSLEGAAAELERAVASEQEAARGVEEARCALAALEEARALATSARNEAADDQAAYALAAQASERAGRAWSEANRRLLDEQAGILAESLVEGQPCPVCGSTAHPTPASRCSAPTSPEEVEGLERSWASARQREQAASERAARSLARAKEREEAHAEALAHAGNEACARRALEQARERLESAARATQEARARADAQKAARAEADAARAAVERARAKAEGASSALAEAHSVASAREATRKALEANAPVRDEHSAQAALAVAQDAHTNAIGAVHAARADAERAKALREETARARQRVAEAQDEAARLESASRMAGEEKAAAAAHRTSLAEGLEHPSESKAREELARLEAARARIEEARERAREALEDARRKEAANGARTTALEEQVARLGTHDEDAVAARLSRASERAAAADEARARISARLEANRRSLARTRELSERAEGLEQELSDIELLASTASGSISGKARVSFETFVQARYLDLVLQRANARLEGLTDGRFELVRRREPSSLRAQVGLDLDVVDHYTGKARDASSLSGGESFKASLSLALGLSDVVQHHAGGVQLDTMFVDEGFGSLDQESLRLALATLAELSSSGKLVGIISHVEELKDGIDRKVVVTKGRCGSTLRIEA